MNRRIRLFAVLLAFCLLVQMGSLRSLAAEGNEPYTYQITFYAGNQGIFLDGSSIQVVDAGKRPATAQISVTDSAITVKGLKAGWTVSFNNVQSSVGLEQDSPYYVRGLRKGGYDNDEVASSAFQVEQDQDYVVAYGIRGDMVSYVIRYEDTSGNTLADSRTYYGNVGDRPVVAFLYIEGFEPQAYNLTRTLSKNEAENVFTFVYAPVPAGENAGAASTPGEDAVVNPAAGSGGAAGAGGGAGADIGETEEESGDNPAVDMAEEEVPLSNDPEELIDLDEEQVPLSYRIGNLEQGAKNMLGAVVVAASSLAAFGVLLVILAKRRRKEENVKK